MGNSTRHKKITRKSFSKISGTIDMPDLLEVQLKSFADFLQENVSIEKRENRGLHAVFKSIFPIVDTRENYILEFVDYFIDSPKYNVLECQERGVTYAAPLKA